MKVTRVLAPRVQVMDRLMSSYGQNILGSLFWAVNQPASKVHSLVSRHLPRLGRMPNLVVYGVCACR
jgi:hypothetical protein